MRRILCWIFGHKWVYAFPGYHNAPSVDVCIRCERRRRWIDREEYQEFESVEAYLLTLAGKRDKP